jgi:arabinofuranan 3-O-arabinosyltransferase
MDKPFSLPCGEGPTVTLDGKSIKTSVGGTIGDLIDLKPVLVSVCTPSGGLPLVAGRHSFMADGSGAQFLPIQLLVKPRPPTHVSTPEHRTAAVTTWASQRRVFSVGAGPATILVMAQNFNPGWVAHLGKQTLRPVRVDGWEQGYVVPPGKAATVTVEMRANGVYDLLLFLGAVLLVGVFVLALLPSRRGRTDPAALEPRPLPGSWLLLGASCVTLVIVGGPLALLLLPLLAVARRWGPTSTAIVAFLSFFVAGVLAAWNPASPIGPGADAFGSAAQIASVIALAAVLASLTADSWYHQRFGRSGKGEHMRRSPGRMNVNEVQGDDGPSNAAIEDRGTAVPAPREIRTGK